MKTIALITLLSLNSVKGYSIESPSEELKSKSSLENRNSKNYRLSIGIGNHFGEMGNIFSASRYLQKNDYTVDLDYFTSSKEGALALEKRRAAMLGFRFFLGNSFNIKLSAVYSDFQASNNKFGGFEVNEYGFIGSSFPTIVLELSQFLELTGFFI